MKTMAERTETTDGSPAYPLRAVDRVCDILDILANAGVGVSLTEVAERSSLPKSSAFRYLSALEARRYVARDSETNAYRLGLAFRPQNTRLIERLVDVAQPALDKLRDQIGETTNLGLLDGTRIVHVVVAESPHMMRLAARVGEHGYVHSTALGKAVCASLSEDSVRSILAASGMPRFTGSTITEPDRFLAELEVVRQQGFGLDDEENQASGRCVAVAIENLEIPAGVSISAPADRLSHDEVAGVVRHLRKAAKSIARQMRE
jgi:IclR family transcriptional regulator, acetate operon repressor